MADYAPNWTPRYKVRYSTRGATHTIQFRLERGAAVGDWSGIATKVGAFLATMNSLMYSDWTVLGATGADTDSDVFLPVTLPSGFAPGGDITAQPASQKSLAVNFIGRSSAGGRAAVYLYGIRTNPVTVVPPEDFRITAAENATIAAAITALDELSPAFAANDGEVVNWYPYVNVKYNDYWVRKTRAGS